jgi:hypothetical protein
MQHLFEKHINCEMPNCPICDGGLTRCTICGGAEGSLPTECPGTSMSPEIEQLVYSGKLDFKDNSWQNTIVHQYRIFRRYE